VRAQVLKCSASEALNAESYNTLEKPAYPSTGFVIKYPPNNTGIIPNI